MFIDYRNDSQTPERYTDWKKRWVDQVHHHQDYLDLLGPARIAALAIKNSVVAEGVDYGY
jgi:hypothetical protein